MLLEYIVIPVCNRKFYAIKKRDGSTRCNWAVSLSSCHPITYSLTQHIFDTQLKTIMSIQFPVIFTEIFRFLEQAQPHCAPSPTMHCLNWVPSPTMYCFTATPSENWPFRWMPPPAMHHFTVTMHSYNWIPSQAAFQREHFPTMLSFTEHHLLLFTNMGLI